ncbi:MAG TPA: alpha/beta hydrolase [Thermoanaerobaculia bacterium]|nr:alpha/beta hydrolase [Thermoanaerobaculia bacterium]
MLLLVGLVLLFLVVLWLAQRRLIYLPLDHSVPPASALLPDAREVRFETADGLELHAWLVQPAGGREWGAVLVLNGNAGHRGDRAPLAAALSRAGLAVLLVDYRGYGDNPGAPSEAGLRRDADGAVDFLLASGYPAQRLVYFGESLGAGVAVELAARRHPAAVVLRSPFTSLADIGRLHYPFLPVRLLLRDRFAAIDRIAEVGAPLLIVAGDRDSIVPMRSSRALYEAAREPKRWVVIPGADHNDLELLAGPRMLDEVVAFLRESVADAGESRR